MKKQWTTVFLILMVLIVVLFAVLNVEPVAINFGFALVKMPLAVILIVTLLLGVLMAVLLSTGIILGYKSEKKKLIKENDTLETKNEQERNQLIKAHKAEIQSLKQEKEDLKKEVKQLNRRITNMDASQHHYTEE